MYIIECACKGWYKYLIQKTLVRTHNDSKRQSSSQFPSLNAASPTVAALTRAQAPNRACAEKRCFAVRTQSFLLALWSTKSYSYAGRNLASSSHGWRSCVFEDCRRRDEGSHQSSSCPHVDVERCLAFQLLLCSMALPSFIN